MGLRVYLVEDAPRLVGILRGEIQAAGGLVVGDSDSATRAIADILTLRPDVVIVDIALREGSGFDVLEALRNAWGDKRPVQMVLTNHILGPYRDAAKKLDVEYFFDKGHQIPEMLRALQALPPVADKANDG